jgi:hypothetical protein
VWAKQLVHDFDIESNEQFWPRLGERLESAIGEHESRRLDLMYAFVMGIQFGANRMAHLAQPQKEDDQ